MGSFAIDPNDPQIIYAGTGEAHSADSLPGTGIIKSTDGGRTWSLISADNSLPFRGAAVSKLFVDPTNDEGRSAAGQTLYAAVTSVQLKSDFAFDPPNPNQFGVYKSTNGGRNWALVSGGIRLDDTPEGFKRIITDLDFTVSAGKLSLFAAVGNTSGSADASLRSLNGIWLGENTADGTISWDPQTLRDANGQEIPPANMNRIVLTSDHSSVVYAAVIQSNGRLEGVFKTVDGGTTWTRTIYPGNVVGQKGNFDLAFELSPSGRLYLGGEDPRNPETGFKFLVESNVGATSWRDLSLGSNGVQPHVDAHSWGFPCDGTVYLGTDGGLWRYDPLPFDAPPR